MSYYEDNFASLDMEELERDFDGCVHGVPWDERCEECDDEFCEDGE